MKLPISVDPVIREAFRTLEIDKIKSDGGTKSAKYGEFYDYGGAVYNVKHPEFGAKGDGVTDDSGAIAAAIAAATSGGNSGTVYFPEGIYAHTGISLQQTMYGVTLLGSSPRRSILLNTHATNNSITIDGTHQPSIRNLGIRGNPDGTGNGIQQITSSGFQVFMLVLENLWIHSHGVNASSGGNGISARPFSYTVRDCLIGGNSTDDPGGGYVGHNRANGASLSSSLAGTIQNCWFADIQSGFVGLILNSSPATTTIRGCNFSSETAGSVWNGIQIDGTAIRGVVIEGCNFENDAVNTMSNGILISGTSWDHIKISSCNFVPQGGSITDVVDVKVGGVNDGSLILLENIPDVGNVNLNDISTGYIWSNPYLTPINNSGNRMFGIRSGRLDAKVASQTLAVGNNNNHNIGDSSTLRFTANAAGSSLTGITSGTSGRRFRGVNVSANTLTISNENANSDASNRFTTVTGADITLSANEVFEAEYDLTSQRWRAWKL